ncbi:CDP-glycerol glycerophosphotransferase family protein [Streptomyces sp. GC420]|uniref:bifunctional glycosyltransferase/CDP-glycerol:glycerophosphate glycerophosphotransferase n=1 Tax=Streptomyces sp. GC420 TaxID=2697568 RepID=UPI0014150853|nr:CDP-glycerol glycerophosphotransferase family protein [Streptomyces sp. GC420]NBM17859.1 glycosyltransferase [Streptomyces sp. GC420]
MPDVTVVVIVYNDAERLPTAVRSVLDQTLRAVDVVIVDDHSTDGSFDIARGLAAAHPERVRAFRLDRNSGGCGAPRNHGIEHARGTYVMFLDSDDTLERNACRNMLAAAERTGADLVSGMCVRVHTDSRHGKTVEWYPWLYARSRVLHDIADLPDLLVYDTLSTNKCYRRAFLLDSGLRFPTGIHYEDLLFSAQAYVAARRIALVPNHVYFWNVVERPDGDRARSISNRRHEIANFTHRMEIHRRIDALLREHGLPSLKRAKDVKFLKHDLVLHLRDLPFRDDSYRREFALLAADYLDGIDPAAYEDVDPIHAVCAYLLRHGDWGLLLPAVDTLTNRDKISSPLVERDGRVYWCDAGHLDRPEGRRALDVTGLGLHSRPLDRMFLRNALTSYAAHGRTVRLGGRIVNPLGAVPPEAALGAELEFRARRRGPGSGIFRFPVPAVRHEGEYLGWEAEIPLGRVLKPLGLVDTVWDVRLRLTADGVRTTTRLTAADTGLAGDDLPVRPRLTGLVGDRLSPEVSSKGHLAFRLVAGSPRAERVRRIVTEAARGAPGRLARTGYRKARAVRRGLTSGETRIRLYHEVFCRLPIRRGTVVFESHLGRQYSDSPRALYEELRRRDYDVEAIWSYSGEPVGFPEDATLVRRWSLPYLKALAQAEFWVDNQSFPLKLTKRPGTTYLQTWHGSALKRMGFDEPGWKLKPRAAREEQQRVLDRFDRFLIRSEHDVRTLARAFRLKERTLLRVGYPRNDVLVRARDRERASGVRERGPLAAELGIPEDRTILLYAPTFRGRGGGGRSRRARLPFDVERFAADFGDTHTLLVRAHYLEHVVLPPSVRGRVADVSSLHDVTPLLLLADALITDYSSVMFDYALLDRPMLFFPYDYEEYVAERGTYFDLLERAPGPVARTEDELFAALKSLDAQILEHAGDRARFVAGFGEYDRGDAAQRVAAEFFSHWSRGSSR